MKQRMNRLVMTIPVLVLLAAVGLSPVLAAGNTPDITLGSFRIQSTDKSTYEREAVISFSYLLNGNCSVLKVDIELYPEDDTAEIFDSKITDTTYVNTTQGTTAKTFSTVIYIDEDDNDFEAAGISKGDDIVCRIRLYNNTITVANLLVTEYLEDDYPTLAAVAEEDEEIGIADWGWAEWTLVVLAIVGGVAIVVVVYMWASKRGGIVP